MRLGGLRSPRSQVSGVSQVNVISLNEFVNQAERVLYAADKLSAGTTVCTLLKIQRLREAAIGCNS